MNTQVTNNNKTIKKIVFLMVGSILVLWAIASLGFLFTAAVNADKADEVFLQNHQLAEQNKRTYSLDNQQEFFLKEHSASKDVIRLQFDSDIVVPIFPERTKPVDIRFILKADSKYSGCTLHAEAYGVLYAMLISMRPKSIECDGKTPEPIKGEIRTTSGRQLEAVVVDKSSFWKFGPLDLKLAPGTQLSVWLH